MLENCCTKSNGSSASYLLQREGERGTAGASGASLVEETSNELIQRQSICLGPAQVMASFNCDTSQMAITSAGKLVFLFFDVVLCSSTAWASSYIAHVRVTNTFRVEKVAAQCQGQTIAFFCGDRLCEVT
eukprot:GILK01005777.1.p2 GENE.GILK01005777.1~~GILK01005777.1.p2  ORF type:complete len:130 (+),score=12.25 GILK01005777.1:171-560(+)